MRDLKQLNPELQAVIPAFIADCKAHGLIVGIGECYRTVAEQEALYAKGRTTGKAGAIVTNCRGTSYSSPHQWGVAFDFYRNDGRGLFEDGDGWFAKVGAIGVKHGLEWGGNWTGGWVDKPHLQLKKFFRDGTTGYLKRTYGIPGRFMATWGQQRADKTVKSDTTGGMQLQAGKTYRAKFTTNGGRPEVIVGYPNVIRVSYYGSSGSDYFFEFTAIGKKGEGSGVFVNGAREFIINVS